MDVQLEVDEDTFGEGTLNKALWDIEFDVDDMLPPDIITSLRSFATVKGINVGYLVGPLLGAVAHSMRGADVVVSSGYHSEPVLVPVVVVGPKGTNKSGAFNYVMNGIKNLEKQDIEEAKAAFTESFKSQMDEEPERKRKKEAFDQTPYQRYLTRMTPAAITNLLDKRSDITDGKPHVILVYEELSLFLGFMTETPDFMREFLCLTGGSELRKNTKSNGLESIKSPRVNLLGFIQGNVLLTQMASFGADACGLFDRMLFMAPKPPLKDLEVEWNTEVNDGFDIVKVLKSIDNFHKHERKYTFSYEAKEFLKQECNRGAENVRDNLYNDDVWGISSKHLTKVFRLSSVIHNLSKFSGDVEDVEDLIIRVDSVKKAASLVNYSDKVFEILKNFMPGSDATTGKPVRVTPVPVVSKTKWCDDLNNYEKPYSFYVKYAKLVSNIYKLPHQNYEVKLKTIRAKGLFPQCKGKSSYELSSYFVEILLNGGLLRRCPHDVLAVGLLRKEDPLSQKTAEHINAVKTGDSSFQLL